MTELKIKLIDGTEATATVRLLTIREHEKLLTFLGDEPKMLELYCDQPEGWADKLTLESHELLMEEGERLNQAFFERWLQRRITRAKLLAPAAVEA